MITAPQINSMVNMSKASFNGPQLSGQGQSTGGFTNILAAMMSNGDNKGGDMMSMLKSGNMSIEGLLQNFIGAEDDNTGLDPLLLSLIQQLMRNPQEFQDLLKDIMDTGDRGIREIAQMNYGQLKELTALLKEMIGNGDNKQPLSSGLIKEGMKEDLLFKGILSSETISGVSIDDVENSAITASITDIKPALHSAILKMAEGAIKGENISGSISSNKEGNISLKDFYLLRGKDTAEGKAVSTSSEQASINETLDLFSEMAIVEEISGSGSKASNLGDNLSGALKDSLNNAAGQDSNRLQSASIGGTNNQTAQTATTRNEQAIKETLHVSRIQEIDAKIIRAVESGQNSLTIRLEPPELGTLKIKLVLADGMVRADVRVENAAVKDMMNLAAPQIRNSLESAGIKVSEFFVDIREEYYSDGRRHNQDNENGKKHKHSKEKDEDFKPFDFFI